MSSLDQIVRTVDMMMDDPQTTAENIVNVILAEKWNHAELENLTINGIPDHEKQWLIYWAMTNSHQYRRVVEMASDMQQIFPGILFGTALEFCVGYF